MSLQSNSLIDQVYWIADVLGWQHQTAISSSYMYKYLLRYISTSTTAVLVLYMLISKDSLAHQTKQCNHQTSLQ